MNHAVCVNRLTMSGDAEDAKLHHTVRVSAKKRIVLIMSPGVLPSANLKHMKRRNCMVKDRCGSARWIGKRRNES